jgi:hypothetical protein
MPGNAKADVKLGFWIGAGLFLFIVVLAIVQLVIGKATGKGKG